MVINWFSVGFALVTVDVFAKGPLFKSLFVRIGPDIMVLGYNFFLAGL